MTDAQLLRVVKSALAGIESCTKVLKAQQTKLEEIQNEIEGRLEQIPVSEAAQVSFVDADYDFTVRTINILRCMEASNMSAAEFVNSFSKRQFLRGRNAGKKSLMELEDYFTSLGLEWD